MTARGTIGAGGVALVALLAYTTASALTLSPDDIDALGRITFAEAGQESSAGKAAVIAVVLNRAAASGSVQAVVNAPGQFEPVMRAPGRTWRGLPALSPMQQAQFMVLLDLSVSGYMPDVTGGATFFQNREIVAQRARNGTVRPSLVDFGGMPQTAQIGNHTFYAKGGRHLPPDFKGAAAIRAETSFVGAQTSEPGETVFLEAATR